MSKNVLLSDFKEFVEENKEIGSYKEIAEKYLSEHPKCKVSVQALSVMIYKQLTYEENPATVSDTIPIEVPDSFNSSDSENSKYSVIDDEYRWTSSTAGEIKLPVSVADSIFYDYSRYGKNMSQSETRKKHRLTNQQWNTIKSTLRLYKDSNIYSPYTWEHTNQEDLAPMVSNKVMELVNDEVSVVEHEYNNNIIKKYKQIIHQDARNTYESQLFLDNLNSMMPKTKTVYVTQTPKKDVKTKSIVAVIADIHVGASTEGLIRTPDYNIEVAKKRLEEVADAINAEAAENVTLCILGDLIESFSGLNHINSWQSMEKGMHGSKVFWAAADILGEFFEKVSNLKTIKVIGGNHDRSTPDNKMDTKGTIADIISGYWARLYKGIYEIEFNPLLLTYDVDENSRIIMAHGDKRVLKKDMFQASVMRHCDLSKMNYVLTGHLHSRNIKSDSDIIRWYQIPSIFSGNNYSEEGGFNSRPGFFLLKPASDCLRVMDCPLKMTYDK